jgi:hypothetical protein
MNVFSANPLLISNSEFASYFIYNLIYFCSEHQFKRYTKNPSIISAYNHTNHILKYNI